jgi:hypothetical protein
MANTLEFILAQGSFGTGVLIRSSKQAHATEAPEIIFARDGFTILTVPAMSSFDRMLTGLMAAGARLNADQMEQALAGVPAIGRRHREHSVCGKPHADRWI